MTKFEESFLVIGRSSTPLFLGSTAPLPTKATKFSLASSLRNASSRWLGVFPLSFGSEALILTNMCWHCYEYLGLMNTTLFFCARVSNGFSFFSPDASSCRASVWQDFTKLIMDRLDSCASYSFPSLHHVASRLHFWYPANHPVGLIKLSWSSTASICLFKASESKALAKRAPHCPVVVCQALHWNHFPCKWIMSFESHN